MSNTFYEPLTPKLRENIIDSLKSKMNKLDTCKDNAFVRLNKISISKTIELISALPDGYPMPMERR